MINERNCPICHATSSQNCEHLALAVEGREFVQRCVEKCQGQAQWQLICRQQRDLHQVAGAPEHEDYMWLETAFCERFLKHLVWYGGMDYEWRSGRRAEHGGFWVLLWSKEPQRLWWELRDELERKIVAFVPPEPAVPWLLWLTPR